MNSWKHTAIGGGIAIVASIVGTFATGYWQQKQWERDTKHRAQIEAAEARRKIIGRVSDILAHGTVFALKHSARPNDDKNPVSLSLHCLEEDSRQRPMCQQLATDPFHKAFVEEFLPMHREYLQVSTAVRLHFCAQSVAVFERHLKGHWWWNASNAKKREVLNHLEADVNCPPW